VSQLANTPPSPPASPCRPASCPRRSSTAARSTRLPSWRARTWASRAPAGSGSTPCTLPSSRAGCRWATSTW
jgi:hypothetical protein